MKGWFDAFRTEGGPTLYSFSNRTPVTGDLPTISLYIIFFTLFLAFLIIFPGVRKERFATFTSVTLSLFVGTVILITNKGSCWHVGESIIKAEYRAFSPIRIEGKLGVYIGLEHINVTLESSQDPLLPESNFSLDSNDTDSAPRIPNHGMVIDYNERFWWRGADEISHEMRNALAKGLPYPILTVLEYFSVDDEGFTWGRMYRLAGYYSNILLWASFASWLLMNLLLIVVPRYGAYQMIITSLLMLSTNLIYYWLLPSEEHPLVIHIEERVLTFDFGWSFWLVLIAGGLCGVVGSIIAMVDWIYPHKFSTILEVDYDTPYDRHIIIEESFKGKGRGKSLEDPIIDTGIGIGRKILRTLSSKSRGSTNEKGLVNNGFEMDAPKSPWANYNRNNRLAKLENNSLIDAMAKNPNLARLAQPNHMILNGNNNSGTGNRHGPGGPGANGHVHGLRSPKSVSFRRQSKLEITFDISKRDESDDDSISSVNSDEDQLPQDAPSRQFPAELDVGFNGIIEAEDYPKPRLIPRVSYDGHHHSNSSGSRRGSNESSNFDNHSTASLSGFSSNSFEPGDNKPNSSKSTELRGRSDGGNSHEVSPGSSSTEQRRTSNGSTSSKVSFKEPAAKSTADEW